METNLEDENVKTNSGNDKVQTEAKDKKVKIKDSLVVWLAFHFFDWLSKVSLFYQIRIIAEKVFMARFSKRNPGATSDEVDKAWKGSFFKGYVFPELWVIANLAVSVAACFIIPATSCNWLCCVLVIYAACRAFAIFVYQINVLLFDPIKKGLENYQIKSATRMILLLLCNIVEYVLWFSVIYLFVLKAGGQPISATSTIRESLLIISNNASPEEMTNSILTTIAYVEFVLGLFMNLLCLARFINLLPAVRQVDKY